MTWAIDLAPGQSWHSCCYLILDTGIPSPNLVGDPQPAHQTRTRCYEVAPEIEALQKQWFDGATHITTAQEEIYRLYRQSLEDMGALRLYAHDMADDIWVPAAGVPWFVTLFGRDSLIVSLQNMTVHPNFALGALQKLAQFQATEIDDWRDAQPGRILHELRNGELAHFERVPHTPCYGTADATPLYLIVLHETWKWIGDDSLLHQYRDVAMRCLEWIDRDGDMDGDGFQEYQTRSPQGIANQGWKDSGDAIADADGNLVKTPIALCELQGYVFDAWLRMAEIFTVLGEPERAIELQRKAAELKERFDRAFWREDLGYYALALDGDKQPVRTIASNAGHCLWSGIVPSNRAAQVVAKLMSPELWSGLAGKYCKLRAISACWHGSKRAALGSPLGI